MQLLLDTHIWIWSVSAPENLSPRVRKALDRQGQLILTLTPDRLPALCQALAKFRPPAP